MPAKGQTWEIGVRVHPSRIDRIIFLVIEVDVHSLMGLVLYSEYNEVVAGQCEPFTTSWVKRDGSLLCETTVR